MSGKTNTPSVAMHTGYLVKKGKIIRNWKLRWFVLIDGKLSYYKSPEERGPLGTINVRNIRCGPASSLLRKYDDAFQIHAPKRIYFMYAHNKREFEKWRTALIQHGALWDTNVAHASVILQDGTIRWNDQSQQSASRNRSDSTVDTLNRSIDDHIQANWFFRIDRQTCVNLLYEAKEDCFLIRPSSQGSYALSRIRTKDKQIEHFKIVRSPVLNGVQYSIMDSKVDNRQYPDIQTLVRETPELLLFKAYSDEKAVEQILAKKPTKENLAAIQIPLGTKKDDGYQYGPVPAKEPLPDRAARLKNLQEILDTLENENGESGQSSTAENAQFQQQQQTQQQIPSVSLTRSMSNPGRENFIGAQRQQVVEASGVQNNDSNNNNHNNNNNILQMKPLKVHPGTIMGPTSSLTTSTSPSSQQQNSTTNLSPTPSLTQSQSRSAPNSTTPSPALSMHRKNTNPPVPTPFITNNTNTNNTNANNNTTFESIPTLNSIRSNLMSRLTQLRNDIDLALEDEFYDVAAKCKQEVNEITQKLLENEIHLEIQRNELNVLKEKTDSLKKQISDLNEKKTIAASKELFQDALIAKVKLGFAEQEFEHFQKQIQCILQS